MITFTRDWNGYPAGASVGTLAATTEAAAVAAGAAVYGGTSYPLRAGLDRYGNVTSLVDGAGNTFSPWSVHPALWCDLSADTLCADDGAALDGSGNGRHAVRGIALPVATMNAAAGYFATAKGSGSVQSTLDTALHMPSINLDYDGGESMLVVMTLKMTAPGSDEPIFGNSGSTSNNGFRMRARSTGYIDHTMFSTTGAISSASGNSLNVLVDAALHQVAVLIDGKNKNRAMWEDGTLTRATITAPETCDTRESAGLHLGGIQLAPSAASNTAAVSWRRVTIFRWGPTDTLPAATDMTPVIQRLRNNPTRVPQRGDF